MTCANVISAFVGTLENEFMRVAVGIIRHDLVELLAHPGFQFTCDGNSIVPRNPPGVNKYP